MAARTNQLLLDLTPAPLVTSLFAGPGGWCQGLRQALPQLGDDRHIGVEIDPRACATRAAAGHRTVAADIRTLDPVNFAGTRLLIGSPPCQSMSAGGKRLGLGDDYQRGLDVLCCIGEGCDCSYEALEDDVDDLRSALVVEPLRWAVALEDHGLEYLLLEQVPAAEFMWEDLAAELFSRDWASVDVAVVDAADYGAPQHRRRAVLCASRTVGACRIPSPTHGPGRAQPHNTPASVLGLAGTVGFARRNDRPDGGAYRARDMRSCDRPSFTLTEKVRSWTYVPEDGSAPRKLTMDEIAQLQTFAADYPFAGSRTAACLQAANAVPPLLAQRLIEGCLNLDQSWGRRTAGQVLDLDLDLVGV